MFGELFIGTNLFFVLSGGLATLITWALLSMPGKRTHQRRIR
jgi:hypothetical protein